MDILITQPKQNLRRLMREVGYLEIQNRDGSVSYERPLQGIPYPRFHVYSAQGQDGITLKLHLDQKRPSYEGTHAHGGEYEGQTVETEAERIKNILVINS